VDCEIEADSLGGNYGSTGDAKETAASSAATPESMDQKNVAFTAMAERVAKRNGGGAKYSERFVHYCVRVLMLNLDMFGGVFNSQVCYSLKFYGQTYALECPYSAPWGSRPSETSFVTGRNNQVMEFATVDISLPAFKSVLAAGGAFCCGFDVFKSWYDKSFTSYTVTLPLPGEERFDGHCVEIVGYDDVEKRFKFKNSWGREWGEGGYGFLPYSYIPFMYDAVIITAMEMYQDGHVVRSRAENWAQWGITFSDCGNFNVDE
jgi:hypothetical protein